MGTSCPPDDAAAVDLLDWKNSARVATTVALPANTLAANRLTAVANGAFPAVDGIALVLNDSILVKNEVAGEKNGIYTLIQVGDGATPYILERRSDANSSAEVTTGMTVPIEEGVVNADTAWTLTTIMPIVLNTTALVFQSLFSLQDWASVLVVGNTSGGTDVEITAGDQLLMEGAAAGDAAAGVDNIILGDGSANDFGMTFFFTLGNKGEFAWNDGLNQRDGGISYNGFAFTYRTQDTDHYEMNSTELKPLIATINLGGTAAAQRWATGFLDDLVLGDGVIANGVAGANTFVNGGGGGDRGMTIFTGNIAGDVGKISITGVSATEDGFWTYEPNTDTHEWGAAGVAEMLLTTAALSPAADAGNSLGTDPLRWLEGFIDQVLIAGAVNADADAGFNDVIIGDGTATATGVTFNVPSGTVSGIAWNDGANQRDGTIVYNGDNFIFRTNNVNRYTASGTAFSPVASGSIELGATANRWEKIFVEGPVWGIEPSAADIAVDDSRVIVVDAGAADVNVNLPTAADGLDYVIIVLAVATNTVTVVRGAGDTINGAAANKVLATVGRYFITALDSTDWRLHGPVAEV